MSDKFWRKVWIFIGVYFAIVLIGKFAPHDDTDPSDGRSGLGLYVDHRTGCHYLGGGLFGGITPRLDRSGKHICESAP